MKAAKQKKAVIPSRDDFVSWVAQRHPLYAHKAGPWWDRFESQDWIDSQGNAVLNAKSKFNTWVQMGWINNIKAPVLQTARSDERW